MIENSDRDGLGKGEGFYSSSICLREGVGMRKSGNCDMLSCSYAWLNLPPSEEVGGSQPWGNDCSIHVEGGERVKTKILMWLITM